MRNGTDFSTPRSMRQRPRHCVDGSQTRGRTDLSCWRMNPRPRIEPKTYVAWRSTALGAITEALEDRLLFELLGDAAGRRVLEVGCGDGAFALALRARGADTIGVDPDPSMLAAARSRFAAAGAVVPLAAAAGEHLPFVDASFDVVIAKTVLCFVGDATAMIGEMARVLKPGGRFVIGELGKRSWWAAERRIRAWLGSCLWRRARFRTPGELMALAAASGLVVRQLRGAVHYPRAAWAARLMAPADDWLGRRTTLGAAFLALSATKME
jgi:SAM-dependent methyltransferase